MTSLLQIPRTSLLCLVLVGGSLFVSPVQAAKHVCKCYCQVDGVGATKNDAVTASACQDACAAQGRLVAACAFNSAQLPAENIMCFNASECTGQGGTLDTKYQPGECLQGERYCYADSNTAIKAKLQVSIGSFTSPKDLGEYVAAAYKWMIGSATLIAIVLIMVGGLQWSIAAASAEQIGQAKKRILNGVVGLVLLLSTYLILATVNPNLLKLQVPQLPMIKLVALVDGETSCGYLTGIWGKGSSPYLTKSGAPTDSPHAAGQPAPKGGKPYTLEKPSKGVDCGSVATITKDWEGNQFIPEGTTCTYDFCPNKGEKCFVSVAGGQCVSCVSIVSGNSYFTPSSSRCQSMSMLTGSSRAVDKANASAGGGIILNDIINECFWTTAAFLNTADFTANYTTWDDGACAILSMDCSQIDLCEDYDTKAIVINNSATKTLENVVLAGMIGNTNFGDKSLTTVCSEDPCRVASKVGMEGKKCSPNILAYNYELFSTDFFKSLVIGNDCKQVVVDSSLLSTADKALYLTGILKAAP